jgi:hypothetical protein
MIIVCNGGYRTGSTLTFNLCVKIAEAGNNKVLVNGLNNDLLHEKINNYKPNEYWVIKSHDFSPVEYYPFLKVVHSYRHPYQVAASNIIRHREKGNDTLTREDNNHVINIIKKQKENTLKIIERKDCLLLSYDNLVTKLEDVIRKTAIFLNINLDKNQIINIKNELSIKNIKKYCSKLTVKADPLTQLRKNHIGMFEDNLDYWKSVVPSNMIERINREVNIDYINF